MSHFIDFKTILELKRYSKSTISAYIGFVEKFAGFLNLSSESLHKLEDRDVITTIISLVKKNNYSISSQKQLIGAVNLFYKELFKRQIDFSIIYPTRKEERIPVVLSKNEVKSILNHTNNIKHKTILSTIYGLGLRVSELVNLRINDIDSDRMLVHIHNSKGKKDRMVMLPVSLLKLLRTYFKAYKPKHYLFEGQKNTVYSASSVRKVLKASLDKANINKPASVHTLRHSFATHLLENGTDVRIIQKLLGHKNIKTTLLYTQVAQSTIQNVKSPIDLL